MSAGFQAAAGAAAACLGWLSIRRVADAPLLQSGWRLLADAAVPVTIFSTLSLLTARPLFSGLLTAALGGGYAYAEYAKRRSLQEPIVFTDLFQAVDVFRHPRIAAPFPHRVRILVSTLSIAAAVVALFLAEPPLVLGRPWSPILLIAALSAATYWAAGHGNQLLARRFRQTGMTGDPFADSRRFGALGMLIGHGLVARAERSERQSQLSPPGLPVTAVASGLLPPVVLVQCESFFDARRLDARISPDLLPNFDACCQSGLQWGRLTVPCWGANTVRSEFEVLTGLSAEVLGFDRLNPYHRFARMPIDSLAWRLRQAGYRTVCIHPYDRRFYGRNKVMALLGFDEFIGEEAFASAPRINGYVTDAAVGEAVNRLLAAATRPVFVFAITIENHGPWTSPVQPQETAAPPIDPPSEDALAMERYLRSLRNADAMLGALTQGRYDGRVVGFYGDHQPSLRSTACSADRTSDYLIWCAGAQKPGRPVDLAAADLAAALLGAFGAAQLGSR